MASKKPQDLRDIIETIAKITGNKAPKKSSSAVSSAYVSAAKNIQGKTLKKTAAVAKKGERATVGAAKVAFGDPKKGWKDVAINTGAWLIPYGKAFKVVDASVQGAKYYKTAKAVRGAIKGAALIGAPTALSKAINAIPEPSKKRRNIAVSKKTKDK